MHYSACLELLFAEAGPFPERIRAARAAGFDTVEFWLWSNKDLNALRDTLIANDMSLVGFLAEPIGPLTDPAFHDTFLDGLKRSAEAARFLGAAGLLAQAGPELPDRPREAQHAAVVDCLARAADVMRDAGLVLMLEPLNTTVDHVGYFLPSTIEGLDIIDEVGRPEIRLIYDIYHSAVMGEKTEDVLAGRIDRLAHVHLADAPGRHEPGSGSVDWRHRLDWLVDNGYRGKLGLEYQPTGATIASLQALGGPGRSG